MKSESRKWIPFIGLSIIYIVSSLSINYNRYLHLDIATQYDNSDYYLHSFLADMVSRGINPYSVWLHRFSGEAIIPHLYCQYVGNSVLNGIVLLVSGVSPKVAVAVISSMLSNIFMLLAIWAVCRMLKFSPTQSFFFFLFFCFLNDQMLYRTVYGGGELTGTALGLVGLVCYIKKEYRFAIPCIGVSSWIHLSNLGYFAILVTWFLLSVGYVLIKNKFQVRGLVNKISFRNVYVKQVLSLLTMGLIVGGYLFPIFQQKTCYWYEKEPVDPIESELFQSTMPSKWSGILSSGEIQRYGGWTRAQRLTDWASILIYPLTSIYSSFFPRSTLNSTLRLFGYNLTPTDLESIRSFSLNTPVFVAIVPVIYGLGFPLLFVITLWVCIKSRDTEKILFCFAAYLLVIFFSAAYFILGIGIHGHRFIKCVGYFWILAIIPSGLTNPNSRIKKIGLCALSLFLVVRFIIYFMGVMY